MSQDFDAHAATYRRQVDDAIGFSGQNVEFFAERKAVVLAELADRRLGIASERSVLDVGCGIGLVDGYLASRFAAVAGTDVSAAELAAATEAYPDIEYRVSQDEGLPYEAGAFDMVFASCVLHHVEEPGRGPLVGELVRVARPGGLIVVFEHNPRNPLTRLVVRRIPFDAGVRLLRPREVKDLLRGAGVRHTGVRYMTFVPVRGEVANRIESGLAWLPLGAQYAVIGEKER